MNAIVANQAGASVAIGAARVAGRAAGSLRPVAGGATRIGAVASATAIGAMWASVYGIVNIRKYRKGQKTKKEAVRDTAVESIGVGLATGAGVVAANLAGAAALAVGSGGVLVAFVVGTAVTGGVKRVWDETLRKRRSL